MGGGLSKERCIQYKKLWDKLYKDNSNNFLIHQHGGSRFIGDKASFTIPENTIVVTFVSIGLLYCNLDFLTKLKPTLSQHKGFMYGARTDPFLYDNAKVYFPGDEMFNYDIEIDNQNKRMGFFYGKHFKIIGHKYDHRTKLPFENLLGDLNELNTKPKIVYLICCNGGKTIPNRAKLTKQKQNYGIRLLTDNIGKKNYECIKYVNLHLSKNYNLRERKSSKLASNAIKEHSHKSFYNHYNHHYNTVAMKADTTKYLDDMIGSTIHFGVDIEDDRNPCIEPCVEKCFDKVKSMIGYEECHPTCKTMAYPTKYRKCTKTKRFKTTRVRSKTKFKSVKPKK